MAWKFPSSPESFAALEVETGSQNSGVLTCSARKRRLSREMFVSTKHAVARSMRSSLRSRATRMPEMAPTTTAVMSSHAGMVTAAVSGLAEDISSEITFFSHGTEGVGRVRALPW